jgi:hypothetical protein
VRQPHVQKKSKQKITMAGSQKIIEWSQKNPQPRKFFQRMMRFSNPDNTWHMPKYSKEYIYPNIVNIYVCPLHPIFIATIPHTPWVKNRSLTWSYITKKYSQSCAYLEIKKSRSWFQNRKIVIPNKKRKESVLIIVMLYTCFSYTIPCQTAGNALNGSHRIITKSSRLPDTFQNQIDVQLIIIVSNLDVDRLYKRWPSHDQERKWPR